MTGKVYLVGSGPGGLGLMTYRAREVIEMADVILYDQLPGDDVLSSLPDVEKVDVGKFGGKHTKEQDEIELLMVKYAKDGKTVVRLKGGDPFLFGRGGEEMETLHEHGIEVEMVPGVTSAIAVPECVGIPVTHRKFASQVTFLTGHEDPTKEESAVNWKWLADSPGTIVILMGVKNLPNITKALIDNGMDDKKPVAIIERGMRPDQRVTTGILSDISDKAKQVGVKPPAIIVIGEVVSLYRE
ncbi:uroporphyrinogen-III C-methyltransferase [Methanoplanus sp. FWC-SCC4]|uniref:uroporphyrinogen-III C-methyltransferase n=1 Tax=Methanochimaera problematica TaxID=2609417 RepID=A0AA97FCU9_9EURY|nr:uroporphyrinogen-III C-methyltransferase [Methanoplanus sp. FWC-SCC4]WOF15889.1 uroporphyrinogen-III C-methyltransferase [Methanoplanus sp. FWC-SCC4]